MTEGEVARVRGGPRLHPLDEDAQNPPRTRADSQSWNEDTGWNLDTEGNDCKPPLDGESDEQGIDDRQGLRGGIKDTETRLVARFAVFEKLINEFRAAHFGVWVDKSEAGGDRGNL